MDYFSCCWHFSLLSIHGFIITIGAFGILALNIVWLTVYKPKSNGQAFESTAKPTIYLSIIGLFIMSVLMNILFYIVLYDDFFDIGLKLYGDNFHFIGKTLFFISILLFALGTIFAFQIQKHVYNIKTANSDIYENTLFLKVC